MPWRRKGREIQIKRGGKWVHYATAKSVKNAIGMQSILNRAHKGISIKRSKKK